MVPLPRVTTTAQGKGPGPPYLPLCWAILVISAAIILAAYILSIAAFRLFSLCVASSSSAPPPHPNRGRRGGMDPAEVGSLPVRAYDGGGAGAVVVCAVCLRELQANERVKAIPACGHVFHPPCIDRWLAGRASCPLCRCSADAAPKESQAQQQELLSA